MKSKSNVEWIKQSEKWNWNWNSIWWLLSEHNSKTFRKSELNQSSELLWTEKNFTEKQKLIDVVI